MVNAISDVAYLSGSISTSSDAINIPTKKLRNTGILRRHCGSLSIVKQSSPPCCFHDSHGDVSNRPGTPKTLDAFKFHCAVISQPLISNLSVSQSLKMQHNCLLAPSISGYDCFWLMGHYHNISRAFAIPQHSFFKKLDYSPRNAWGERWEVTVLTSLWTSHTRLLTHKCYPAWPRDCHPHRYSSRCPEVVTVRGHQALHRLADRQWRTGLYTRSLWQDTNRRCASVY